MTKRSFSGLLLSGLFILIVTINPLRAETEATISTREDVTLSFIVTKPNGPIKSAAILFSGGSGKIKLWKGRGPRSKNFLVRSRARFAKRGVLTITVDVPSDRRRKGAIFWRDSDEHRQDIASLIKWVKTKTQHQFGLSVPAAVLYLSLIWQDPFRLTAQSSPPLSPKSQMPASQPRMMLTSARSKSRL